VFALVKSWVQEIITILCPFALLLYASLITMFEMDTTLACHTVRWYATLRYNCDVHISWLEVEAMSLSGVVSPV
jgi:hypothetical protein